MQVLNLSCMRKKVDRSVYRTISGKQKWEKIPDAEVERQYSKSILAKLERGEMRICSNNLCKRAFTPQKGLVNYCGRRCIRASRMICLHYEPRERPQEGFICGWCNGESTRRHKSQKYCDKCKPKAYAVKKKEYQKRIKSKKICSTK